jgi:hypothetical protein
MNAHPFLAEPADLRNEFRGFGQGFHMAVGATQIKFLVDMDDAFRAGRAAAHGPVAFPAR